MADVVHRDRRRFLGRAALSIAAAHLGVLRTAEASQRVPRELAAIARATEWLNSPPLPAASLLGRVVVVDFCTYTCINWLRTLPYVRAWSQKSKQGLVVLRGAYPGVRIREEPRQRSPRCAADEDRLSDRDRQRLFDLARIQEPVLAALYFVDARGRIRDHHFGEGEYERSRESFNGCWQTRVSPTLRVASCR